MSNDTDTSKPPWIPPPPVLLHQSFLHQSFLHPRTDWIEWTAIPDGRYMERVIERRTNPFGGLAIGALGNLVFLYFGLWASSLLQFYPITELGRGFHEVLMITPTGWPRLDVILAGVALLGPLGYLAVRLRPREAGRRRREDSYYPPKEYKAALSEAELESLRTFAEADMA